MLTVVVNEQRDYALRVILRYLHPCGLGLILLLTNVTLMVWLLLSTAHYYRSPYLHTSQYACLDKTTTPTLWHSMQALSENPHDANDVAK